MKIAFLTPEFPNSRSTASGGIGTSLISLSKSLIDEDHQVIMMLYGQQTDAVFHENGIEIHLIRKKKYPFLSWYRYRKHLQGYINNEISSQKIDLIEAPDWTGITAFMRLKAPLVIRFHGSDAYFCHLENRKQKFKNFMLEKLAIMNASAYVSPSEYAANVTREIFRIKKKIVTIPNGISMADFQNDSPGDYQKGMVLYVGTIIRKKGVLELPAIFREVRKNYPEARLVLVGNDSADIKTGSRSTWQIIENMLNADERHKITYVGKVAYEKVRDYIKQANVCVFPTFAETQGMVTIEAMAMSKAVVNSNIGWSKELMEDGVSGYLVNPKDHQLYAAKILALLSNDTLCFSMGRAAQTQAAKLFDVRNIVKRNVQFYNSIVKS